MTRDEIEKRLSIPLLAVHTSGMHDTKVARERELEAATEQLLNAVGRIVSEVEMHTTMNIAKSVRKARG